MKLHAARMQLCAGGNLPASSLAEATGSEASQGDVATDGTWTIGGGSMAGFRSQLSVLGHMTSIVGHSTALIGSIHVVGGCVAAGSFRIDLASLRIFGNSNAGLNRMIDTTRYPAATFTLNKPIALRANPRINVTYRAPATGSLTMHGISRPVTFAFTARYTGPALEAAGSIAVRFSDWNLKAPFGIQTAGAIEFTLRMSRAPGRFPALRSLGTGTPAAVTSTDPVNQDPGALCDKRHSSSLVSSAMMESCSQYLPVGTSHRPA